MEGINKQIFKFIEPYLGELTKYRGTNRVKSQIEKFLSMQGGNNTKRQNLAVQISANLLLQNSKWDIPKKLLTDLAKLEFNLRGINPGHRDHVCHSLSNFLLGWAIIQQLKLYQISKLEWKLASLLHDVGYPLELSNNFNNFLRKYEKSILKWKQKDRSPKTIHTLKDYTALYKPKYHNFNRAPERDAAALIDKRLKKWGLSIKGKTIFNKTLNREIGPDHGIISAILVMKAIDKKYEDNNPLQEYRYIPIGNSDWNFEYMEEQVTNACSAIFIHNQVDDVIFDFNEESMKLATLLKVCDELQNWDRPKGKDCKGEPPRSYSLKFLGKNIIFYVNNKDKKKNLKEKLKSVHGFPLQIKVMSNQKSTS